MTETAFERIYLRDLARTFQQLQVARRRRARAGRRRGSPHAGRSRREQHRDRHASTSAGNLRSRFTDFLTTDGEKPDREPRRRVRDAGAGVARASYWPGGTLGLRRRWRRSRRSRPRTRSHGLHPAGSVSRRRSAEPIGHPHRVSRRPDRVSRQAFCRTGLDDAHGSEGQVGGGEGRLQDRSWRVGELVSW